LALLYFLSVFPLGVVHLLLVVDVQFNRHFQYLSLQVHGGIANGNTAEVLGYPSEGWDGYTYFFNSFVLPDGL
jgi:hypothetical protein